MEVIVHCPPGTFRDVEVYICGDLVRTSFFWDGAVSTIRVWAFGGRKETHWSEPDCPVFVAATRSGTIGGFLLHEYDEYEYVKTVPAPPPFVMNRRYRPDPLSVERINKQLNTTAKKIEAREKEGYLDEYEIALPEPEGD